MQLLKINNPLWIPQIAPLVQKFCERVPIAGINYHSLIAYFQGTAQYGGETNELWIAFENDEPVAFVNWSVAPPPFFGVTTLNYIYNSTKQKEIVREFIKEWQKFSINRNCPIGEVILRSEKLMKYFEIIAQEEGYKLIQTGSSFVIRKQEVEK